MTLDLSVPLPALPPALTEQPPEEQTPERIMLAQLERELAEEQARAETARKARAEAADSAEARALALRAKIAAARAEREAEEREALDDKAWREAQAVHGARCARVYTGAGWLILRANTALEWEGIQARAEGLQSAALEAGDASRASKDVQAAFREGILTKSVVHPKLARAREIVAEFHGVWPELYAVRDELNRGPRAAAGKGDAR